MSGIPLRLLFLNTYLLRVIEADLGRHQIRIASEPRVGERAHEIGVELRGAYDVMALAEVFNRRDLEAMRAAWDDDREPETHVGPVSTTRRVPQTSGLATMVAGPEVGRVARRGFETRGSRIHDADAWAEKGALLCEISHGATTIEVTSTHLIAGGGLLPRPPWSRGAPDRDRSRQLAELRRFVDDHHRPGNLQLVVGDFNVEADDGAGGPTAAYDELRRRFDGLDDLWTRDAERGRGPTADIVEGSPEFRVDPDDPRFYADTEPLDGHRPGGPVPSARIDYALGSPGLEVTAFRRRRFPRPTDTPGRAEIGAMSDHVGLHLELRV